MNDPDWLLVNNGCKGCGEASPCPPNQKRAKEEEHANSLEVLSSCWNLADTFMIDLVASTVNFSSEKRSPGAYNVQRSNRSTRDGHFRT